MTICHFRTLNFDFYRKTGGQTLLDWFHDTMGNGRRETLRIVPLFRRHLVASIRTALLMSILSASMLQCWAHPYFQGLREEDPAIDPTLLAAFVALASTSYDCTSEPLSFTAQTAPASNSWTTVSYGANNFVALSMDGSQRGIISNDGVSWTLLSVPSGGWLKLDYVNGLFSGTGYADPDSLMTSLDGISWTTRTDPGIADWSGTAFGNGVYVTVGSGGSEQFLYSTDAATWVAAPYPGFADDWYDVAFGNGVFVAVGGGIESPAVATSPDGINWTQRSPSAIDLITGIEFNGSTFVAVGLQGEAMYSFDGIAWNSVPTPGDFPDWLSLGDGNGLLIAVGWDSSGTAMTSLDGITWTALSVPDPGGGSPWTDVTYGNGTFVAVTDSGSQRLMHADCQPLF